jgi:hypothetical protein
MRCFIKIAEFNIFLRRLKKHRGHFFILDGIGKKVEAASPPNHKMHGMPNCWLL